MLARPPPWLWVLLLLLLLPILVSCQVETQDLDTAVLYECVVGNLLSTSRRAAAAREQVPSVVPAAVVQAAAAALQTAGVKVNNMLSVRLARPELVSPDRGGGSLPENETNSAENLFGIACRSFFLSFLLIRKVFRCCFGGSCGSSSDSSDSSSSSSSTDSTQAGSSSCFGPA